MCNYCLMAVANKLHCTTNTSMFSLVLSREPLGALLSEKIKTPEGYSTISPTQTKLKALESLKLFKQRAEKISEKGKESHEKFFKKGERTASF